MMLEALALLLIFEGLLPVIAPAYWRKVFSQLLTMNDGQLRFMGLASLAAGIALFLIVRP